MTDFRSSAEFQALMISLRRIEDVNRVAFKAAQASERKPQDHHDRRRLEQENRLLGRQMRSSLLCSAYSFAEAAIAGLAPNLSVPGKVVKDAYGLTGKPSSLHFSQYKIQHVSGVCKGEQWNIDWSRLHRLRGLRNTLIHDGGIGVEDELSETVDSDEGFRAWVEPMFEGLEVPIFVLVVGELHFRNWLQRLQTIILNIDSELSKSLIGNAPRE